MSKEAKLRWWHRNAERLNAARRVGPATLDPRLCEVCETEFTPNKWNQLLCGDPDCARERRNQRRRANRAARREAGTAASPPRTREQRAARNAADRDRYRANPEPKRTRSRERMRQVRAEQKEPSK